MVLTRLYNFLKVIFSDKKILKTKLFDHKVVMPPLVYAMVRIDRQRRMGIVEIKNT